LQSSAYHTALTLRLTQRVFPSGLFAEADRIHAAAEIDPFIDHWQCAYSFKRYLSMRMTTRIGTLAAAAVLLSVPLDARAGVITGQLWQNQSGAASNALISDGMSTGGVVGAGSLGSSDATFQTPQISYNLADLNSVYSLGTWLNNPTFTNQSTNFANQTVYGAGLDGGFPRQYGPNGTLDQTYILFTGSAFLNAGNNTFDIEHDDGVQLGIVGINSSTGAGAGGSYAGYNIALSVPGPTSFQTSPFTVNVTNAGVYQFVLAYGENAGPPAALQFLVNGAPVSSTPEPASLTMLSLGAFGLVFHSWRRRKTAV
jgi:hypothetical protein